MTKKYSLKIQQSLDDALNFCIARQFKAAKRIYKKLINEVPDETQILNNLGIIEIQDGNLVYGISLLRKSLKIEPIQPNVLSNLGNALLENNEAEESIVCFERSIELDSRQPQFFYNKARAKKALNLIQESIESYGKALELDSKFIEAYNNRGMIFFELGDYEKALKDYSTAIQIQPKYINALQNRAKLFIKIDQHKSALDDYNNIIQFDPKNSSAYNERGVVFYNYKNFNQALKDFNSAINIKSNNADAYVNLGLFYKEIANDEIKSKENFKKALKFDSSHIEANYNLSIINLKNKEFESGWKAYEYRLLTSDFKINYQDLNPSKRLKDLNIQNNKILVLAEQGLGDEVFYSRFFSGLIKKNKIISLVDERLINLLKSSFPEVTFLSKKINLLELNYDWYTPMASIGLLLNYIPRHEKLYLVNNSKLKNNFLINQKKYLCGIAWKSINRRCGAEKSIALTDLLPIFRLPNISFINLQYGEVSHEIFEFKKEFNIEIFKDDSIDLYNDIDGLASLIDRCDFVITTSNITAHLSGALGKKTFVILPNANGKFWYWHEGKGASDWYSTSELFSQDESLSWKGAIQNIEANISKKYE